LGDAEDCRKPSDYLLRDRENVPSVPECLLVREENFLDDSNCFRNDLENRQSRTESNFRLGPRFYDWQLAHSPTNNGSLQAQLEALLKKSQW
jgi:hypothetical protein